MGPTDVPRLFLGDRAFLGRYGSRLSEDDIYGLMLYAWTKGGLGVSAGDELSAGAAARLREAKGATVLFHTPNLISLGRAENPHRIASLLNSLAGSFLSMEKIENDQIIGAYLRASKDEAISKREAAELIGLDNSAIKDAQTIIKRTQPSIVTYGGDWLDLCILTDRIDIIVAIESQIRQVVNSSCALTAFTYLGACVPNLWDRLPERSFDSLLFPVNLLGDGMVPSPKRAMRWARARGVPIFATHVLALGRIPVAPALDYAVNHQSVDCAVVGCGSEAHIDNLINSAQAVMQKSG
jgi:hypothetical protein